MHLIDGQWVEGKGETFQSLNPSNNAVLWQGCAADAAQVEEAVRSAARAFPRWASKPMEFRVRFLESFTSQLESRKEELTALISQETGKMLWDARGEVNATIGKLQFSQKAYQERTGEKHSEAGTGIHARLKHRPHGVMAVYGPYNFPSHLPNGHITPALLAGNTIVFKPSEHTPLVAQWVVKLWEEVGLPRGVINLVQGEKETGIALAAAPIDGLLFTGSTRTGISLHQQFAGRPDIILALEMGGNNPLIVDEISNITAAIYETIQSAFIGSGQRCTCARRLIITESEQNLSFLAKLIESVSRLRVGLPGDSPEPFMGPLISNREADRVLSGFHGLVAAGGKALLPMQRMVEGLPLLSPGIVDVTDVAGRPDEEWFGPLLQVIRVTHFDQAVEVANQTRFGLAAGVFTDNPLKYKEASLRLKAGIVNWNRQTTGASGMAPFGGVGCSGNHHPAGYYSADYCAYPVASMEAETLNLPATLSPGITL